MIRRSMFAALSLALLLALVAAGCGSKKKTTTTASTVTKAKEGPNAPCGPADPTMSGTPTFPAGFPTPTNVMYTKQKQIGPSKVTFGFRDGDLKSMEVAYKSALPPAGFTVTKAELDPADSEVNFAGKGTTGQVRMVQRCATRTSITILVRPK
jgi:hypothetical protein